MTVEQTRYRLTIEGVQAVTGGLNQVESGFGKVGSKIRDVASSIGGLASLGGALSVGAFAAMIKSSIDAADNLNDLSKSTGITVENLSGLNLLAEQSGTTLEQLGKSINKMSDMMGRDPAGFAKLGITSKDTIEAFKQVADVFNAIQDPQQRAAFGAKVFGEQWQHIASVLSEGGQSIGEAVAKGQMLSGVTQEAADNADKFNDQLAELKAAAQGLSMGLAKEMLPAMNEIIGAIKAAYDDSGKLEALWVAMGGLGAFLFTDEFSSAKVKIKDLEADIARLETNKKNLVGGGYLDIWLFGTSGEIDAKIAAAKAQIASLKKSMEPPPAPNKPAGTTPAGVADFIGAGAEAQKIRDTAIKKSEDFIAQIRKETAAVGASTEDQKLYEAEQIAGQLRLAGVRDDVLLKFLNGTIKEAQALEQRQKQYKLDEEIKAQNVKSIEDLNKAGADTIKQLQDELAHQREYNEQIGQTKETIGALAAARYDQAAAADEESAANLRAAANYAGPLHDAYLQYAADLEKAAQLKRELATGKREGSVKEAFVEQQKKTAEEAQKVWDNFSQNVQRNLGDGLYNAMNGKFEGVGDSFKQMLLRMLADAEAANLTKALFGGGAAGGGGTGALGLLGSVVSAIAGGWGSWGVMNAGVSASTGLSFADLATSFDGGGFTGTGVRTGGIDGKGGFPAILHPQETVTDHTRGQTVAGKTIHLTYAPVTHVDSRTDQRQVEAMIERGNQRGQAQMLDQLQRARLI